MSQKNTDKAKPLAEDKANIMPVTDASSKDKPAEKKKRQALYSENLPTFYCGIGNNSDLIISIMKKLGWEQIFETTSDEYKLKWVQCTRSINWNSFREGDQMVNHIPNCSLFTNKLNLLCSLQAYEKTQLNNPNGHSLFMPLADYVPLTYKLDVPADKEAYFSTAKKDELWICKPVSMNQGKGIYLVRSPEMLKQRLDAAEDGQQKKFGGNKLTQRIIQKYIDNPLLVNRKKFDIRCYMTIASTKPILALFCHGYLRLTMNDFVHDDNNLLTHLTNQFFQKKDEKYKDEKETTTWSMDQFNTYINEHVAPQKNLPKDWVFNDLTKKMRNIMLQVVQSIRFKIQRKIGYFGIYGYDFMIDDNMKVWLIEVNVNPAITTNTEVLNVAIPPAVEEGIKLSVECFEKSKANKKLLPLSSLKNYTVIYNEGQVPCKKPRFDRSPSHVQARNPANAKSQANQINNSATKLSSPNYSKQSGSNSNVNNTDTNQNNVPKSAESSLISKFEAAMFNNVLKSAPLLRRLEQADKIEFLETEQQTKNIINQLKQISQEKSQPAITHSKQHHYQQKKFAIKGTKISEATDSTESLGMTDPRKYEASERIGKLLMARNVPYKATDILSQILQKNLNNYNHLINYNYRVRNHEDELKTNRLNFLYGMRHTEQTFSVRPASLNDLNERLSRIYTIKSSSGNREPDQKDSSTQTRIVYNLSKKQTGNGSGSAVAAYSKSNKNQLNSASMESLELPTYDKYNKLGLVEFNDFQSHH